MSNLTVLPQPAAFPPGVTDPRSKDAFIARFGTAAIEALPSGTVKHVTNGDEDLYADKSATYTKCLKQAGPGVVDTSAYTLFRKALGKSDGSDVGTADFEAKGLLGNGRRLNGPLGAFALTLNGGESQQFGPPTVPPPPTISSAEYATELVELYWASLLRDVPFTDYEGNPVALAACKELTSIAKKYSSYAGPLVGGEVTPKVLFRGGFNETSSVKPATSPKSFAGELFGPYISQFCIQPTNLGAVPIDQKVPTLAEGIDYMTSLDTWQAIQNGVNPVVPPKLKDEKLFLHNGRALASYTHIDELYQAYLIAYLVMNTVQVPTNPANPYKTLTQQQPFGTFGEPDIAAMLGAVARAAINAVWYQKWIVHLRHRPESGGGIVHLIKTKQGANILKRMDGKNDSLHDIVLNSEAVQQSLVQNGSYLLSQAFPEGSPAHPAYPTGHGTVAGACITVLKFFFDCERPFPKPLVPANDGLSLHSYAGTDASQMTVSGELHKLAHNISFGHGIHGGIHWRSDTDYSITLGEAVALRFLHDQAFTYKEDFEVKLKKVDGNEVSIGNLKKPQIP